MGDTSLPPNDDRGTTFIILVAILGFLSTLSTFLRCLVRVLNRQFGWDDGAIIVAWAFLMVEVALNGLQYHTGYGRHIEYIKTDVLIEDLKWGFFSEFIIFAVVCFTKISICLFVLRINHTGWLKWVLYGVMGGLIVTTIPAEVVLFAQCQPIKAFWDRSAGTCWDTSIYNDVIWLQVAFSIFSDLVCVALPVIVLWNIQIHWRLKVAVCGLMSLGFLATACAAVRGSLSTNDSSLDLTWSLAIISIWGCLEENLGIICANLAYSRSMYLCFRHGPIHERTKKSQYQIFSRKHTYRRKIGNNDSDLFTTVKGQEEGSTVPLQNVGITKTTELSVSDGPRSSSFGTESDVYNMNKLMAQDRV